MADSLVHNLQDIAADKEKNLLPENLKAGVTCLGVTGALEIPEGMQVFSSEAEMIAAKDTMEIGDECIVWDSEQASLDRDDRTGPILVGLYRKVSEEMADDPSVPFCRYYGQNRVIDVVNAELVYTAGDEEFGDEIEIELHAYDDGGLVRGAKGGYGLDSEQVAEQLGLTADKLVKGNRILNIEGTAEVGGTAEGAVKLFSSVDEMNADTDAKEGDIALVYKTEEPTTSTSQFQNIRLPKTVVLDEAITDTGEILFTLNPLDNTWWYQSTRSGVSYNEANINLAITGRSHIRAYFTYTTEDGITYKYDKDCSTIPSYLDSDYILVSEDDNSIYVTLPCLFNIITESDWDDIIGKFIIINSYLGGIYTVESVDVGYQLAPTQLLATSDDVCKQSFYGKDGVSTGTLGGTVATTFDDISNAVYGKIQAKYDTMDIIKMTDGNMSSIFRNNKNIIILPTKTTGEPLFDTSNVTHMNGMFYACSRLVNANLSEFNTSDVTNMSAMFRDCESLSVLKLNKFNTSNVTDMNSMFYSCSSLTSLDLSNFDTSNVTNMSWMFYSCSSLTSLDLSNFDTSNVTDMSAMFFNCIRLTSLDLSSFDVSKVTSTSNMFTSVPADCEILVANEAMKEWVLGVRSDLTNVQIKENA